AGALGHRPVHPGLPDAAPLEVARVAMEHAVLRAAVAFGRKEAPTISARHTALDEEDVGLLAGLQDAELGVDGRQLRDEPVRVWLRTALGGRRLVPSGPAVALLWCVFDDLEAPTAARYAFLLIVEPSLAPL